MSLTQDSLVDFLDSDLGIDPAAIEPETLLFSSGLIDSFAFVSLLSHIEDEAGIRIAPEDVNLANLDSISRILAYAERARAGHPG